MTTYVAFLRGINVGGHQRMTMDELRAVLGSGGLEGVETYIQSGNVVFEAAEPDEGALREAIHDAIEDAFGYDVPVMVRTLAALEAVVAGQPFEVPGPDGVRHYVTFLQGEPTEEQVDALLDAQTEVESFAVSGRTVYSELDRHALGDGRRTDVESVLGTPATRRTWNLVTAVLQLAA